MLLTDPGQIWHETVYIIWSMLTRQISSECVYCGEHGLWVGRSNSHLDAGVQYLVGNYGAMHGKRKSGDRDPEAEQLCL